MPVPAVIPPIEVSRIATLHPGAPPSVGVRFGVVVVAVTVGNGAVAGKRAEVVGPDWNENWIEVDVGTKASQSNSPQRTV
jgi:hypothetical protein